MTPDIELPYEYADNPRAGTITIVALYIVASLVMLTLKLTLLPWISWLTVALPVILLAARTWLYSLIRNATHEALRAADADANLDSIVESQMAEKRRLGLTPGFLDAALIGKAG